MDYKVFCPKCGKQTTTESIGNSYGGTGLSATVYCDNCDIYVSCNKESYIERIVIRDNPNPKKEENKYITKVQILRDERGEYLDLELIKENSTLNIQFYIQFYINESNIIPSRVYKDFKGVVCSDGRVTFKLKQAMIKPIKKKMTIEEIEKELGYNVEIVEE